MTGRAAVVGRRLSLGTWRQLETWARWLGGADYAPGESGVAVSVRHLGVILRRVAGSVFVAVFYGSIVQRAYGAIYLVPVVWAIGAWQMSDTSAPPPPGEGRPSCRKCAGHELVSVPSRTPEGDVDLHDGRPRAPQPHARTRRPGGGEQRMITRLLGRLGLDYCAVCGWWTAPGCGH